MTEHQLVTLNFDGDTIFTVTTPDGVYVAIKPICERLSADWSSQQKRLNRDTVLREGKVILSLPSAGGLQETICLPLRLIPGWLFGFEENHFKDPEIRAKVIRYKRDCHSVLSAHFSPQPAAIEATVAETAPILGLEEMSARSSDFWLKMVREARVLGGDAAGRRMWARSPLPSLDPDPGSFSNQIRGLAAFMADCWIVTGTADDWVLSAQVYDTYAAWAQESGQPVWAPQTFLKRFAQFAQHFTCPATGKRIYKTKSSLMGYAGLAPKG